MGDAVIVSAVRTAIGTGRKGTLVDVSAFDLGREALGEALKRSGIPGDDVDDIQLGEVMQGGGDIARYAAVELGLTNVPGVALNRHCASGMAAVQGAAASIRAGMDTVVIAGGTESTSTTPSSIKRVLGTDEMAPWMSPSHPETPDAPALDMSITVGWNTAQLANVTREEMDHWAYESHMRAVSATDDGRFEEEIFPIEVLRRDGETIVFKVDEHPRRGTSLEKLASLPPLHPEIEGFSITAGNASGINDGSAAMMIVDAEYAAAHGLQPLAVIKSWASAGVPPAETGLGPTHAIPKALSRAGLTTGDVQLVEINEAFASAAVASSRILGFDHDIVNVNGSGCTLWGDRGCTRCR
ncbi:MAG TPA: thiolase family protein [Acidimicrobiia bacterium]|nr:thiolase family protein [Acidimicrobiia bacterium]